MFLAEDRGGTDRTWEGHAVGCMYLHEVYSLVREEVMRNASVDVFWSEKSEGSVNRFLGLFRYFLTTLR